MTTPTPPTPPTFKNAKAEARAASAHAKALRPWYKKKRWILSIGFIVLIIIAGAAGSSSDTSDTGNSSSSSASASDRESGSSQTDEEKDDETTGSVGEPVTNAGMTYEVTSARTASTIGDTTYGLGAEADGRFVIVGLELTNNKDETKTFSDSAAKVVTADGNGYEASSEAVMAFGDKSLFLKEVQPDLTTAGQLAFDLPPAKVSGSTLVIEDLFGDGEITIDLGL